MKKILLSFIIAMRIATFTYYVIAAPDEVAKQNVVSEINKATDNNSVINALDEHGFTPLINAIKSSSFDTVNSLLEKGADINLKDDNTGETALMWASAIGNLDVVKLLINKGADINIKNKDGKTAAVLANEFKRNEIAALLKQSKKDMGEAGGKR